MTIAVSVVVPTFWRPQLLRRCLAALLRQDLDPSLYEVIVADDAACEQTRRLVDQVAREYCAVSRGIPVRYLSVSGTQGPAAARNRGWQAARGWLIAFTDDDCVPDPGWLRAGLDACGDDAAGAWGKIVVPAPPTPTDYERNEARLQNAHFATANCFYRRDALEAVGGFDERFRMAWREDSDLFFTLLERGERLVRAPGAVVVHPIRPAPWGVSIPLQRKSVYNALLYKKHPSLYREYIQSTPPWHYYRIIDALLLALLATLRGQRRLAAGALAAWMILTGQFAAQRLQGTSHAPRHVAEMIVTSALVPPLSIWWRTWGAIKYRVVFW